MRTIYICTDSVTGIYSGIYDAWKQAVVNRQEGCGIALKGQVEQELFCEYTEVEEDLKKAAAVDRLIRKNMGEKARRDLYYALLTEDPEKGNAVLGTMFAARSLPDSRKIMEHLSHPMVEKVFELSRAAGGEAHNYKGFLRFRELENGVLYVKLLGQCAGCPSADLTTENLVEMELKSALPDLVRQVVAVQTVSDELWEQAKKLLRDHHL